MTEGKRIIKFSKENVELECELENCNVIKKNMNAFVDHVNTHFTDATEDDLQCKWKDCGFPTKNLMELYRHVMYHAFHAKIKCYGKNFLERQNLPSCSFDSQSRNIIPELPNRFICLWKDCEDLHNNPEIFYRHVESHAYDETVSTKSIKCKWKDCKSSFGHMQKLKDHLRTHTQEKLIACPVCGGTFASRTKFQDHILRQAAINDNEAQNFGFQCGYCYRKFTSERLLRDHMRHHVNHYKCPYCAMTCPNPSGLQSHITYRHSAEKNYACQYCEYRCKSESDLGKHVDSHRAELYKCPIESCDYASRSRTCVNSHVNTKHEGNTAKLYKCHICERSFGRGNYLTKHLIANHHFHWPSGHCRFRYHRHEDGFFRLQTVRYESIELSEELEEEGCSENKDITNQSHRQKIKKKAQNNESIDEQTLDKVPTELTENNEKLQTSTVPMVMYIANTDANDGSQTKQILASEVQSVILNQDGSTSEIHPFVYLNLTDVEKNPNCSNRTIHIIENLNGEAVLQTAEIIESVDSNE